jgi:TonB-linked SusC/RagA family outer membrane protein
MKNNYRRSYTYALSFALFLTYNSPTFSQNLPQKTISGIITSGADPLIGVNVLVKNSARGSISDLEGRYSVTAAVNDTLVFTYLGYKPLEVAVGNAPILNVVMELDAQTLDAVVINAGYYKVSDREKTGSISRVTAKEIEKQPVNNPLEALQGRAAGVDITQNSGIAGGGFKVRIRGQKSIMAGNEPLYIIDGVPYDTKTLGAGNTSGGIIPLAEINPLNAINPEAIESIEILKDADATAIYGSRGANGVILITTKKGKEGKTKFTISSTTGIGHITRKMDLLNTEQYLEMRREAFANDGITEYPEYAYDVNGTWDQSRDTDWQEVLIGGTANIRKVMAEVSGGSATTQFLLSGLYQEETTVFLGNFDYDRITVNTSINHKSENEKFKLTFTGGYTLEKNNIPDRDFAFDAAGLAPNSPALYDEAGNLNWENSTWTNPLARLYSSYKQDNNNLITNTILSYKFYDNLEFQVNAGYGISDQYGITKNPHTIINPALGRTSSSSIVNTNEGHRNFWITEPQLHWSSKKRNSSWDILLGSTFQEQTFEQKSFFAIGFPTDAFMNNLSAATTLVVLEENKTTYKYQSFFGRLNYSYQDKLFFNITGRRDGSSRFGPNNKYGNFGALGVGWIFSEDLNLSWLSFGKIRGSYGISGNDQIGDYQYLDTYSIADYPYDGNIGLLPTRLDNPDYKWEEIEKREAALDLSFLKNKIDFSVSYYNNRSSNQLINYSLPSTTGFNTIQANLDALVENSGFEFELDGTLIEKEDFKWSAAVNFSLPKNKLLAFPDLENSTYANRFVIGQPLSVAKLYKLKGVNPETGIFEFEDFNGDGELTSDDDRNYIADLSPKFFGGISTSLKYKNWSADILFQFVKKQGYNQFHYSEPPGVMVNQTTSVLDRWQNPGDQASMQKFTSGGDFEAYLAYYRFTQSSGVISDASFIRLKSMEIGYDLPLLIPENTSIRIFLQGQNLLTFTNFEGGDPEQIIGYIPPLRRIVFGAKLDF